VAKPLVAVVSGQGKAAYLCATIKRSILWDSIRTLARCRFPAEVLCTELTCM
jgi:hypothetical protein